MKTSFVGWMVATALGMTAAACSSSEADKPVVETVKSNLARDTMPTLAPAELDVLASGEARFAVDVFRTVASNAPTANVFLSPHSISSALAMTYAGARGETAAEMKAALHFDLPADRLHVGFNYLDLQLASRGANARGQDGQPFRLTIANAFWGQKGASFEAPFLDTLAVNYGAGVNVVDFVNATEEARTTINGWVEDKTNDRIQELLKPGLLKPMTRAVLVNAVYFNAKWQRPFTSNATSPAPFTKLDGSTVDVPMMVASESFAYGVGEGYQAVGLPYEGNELSLVAIVPDAGTYATFEAGLTGDKLLEVVAGLRPESVQLGFPKLRLDADVSLKAPLQALGMTKAFDAADFSGISSSMALAIGDVVHKTFLNVDEKGTEAAAATAVVFDERSAAAGNIRLTVDRPFLMAIFDHQTRTLLFLGRVLAP